MEPKWHWLLPVLSTSQCWAWNHPRCQYWAPSVVHLQGCLLNIHRYLEWLSLLCWRFWSGFGLQFTRQVWATWACQCTRADVTSSWILDYLFLAETSNPLGKVACLLACCFGACIWHPGQWILKHMLRVFAIETWGRGKGPEARWDASQASNLKGGRSEKRKKQRVSYLRTLCWELKEDGVGHLPYGLKCLLFKMLVLWPSPTLHPCVGMSKALEGHSLAFLGFLIRSQT